MGIGASSEVLTEDEINQEVKQERSRSKSKKGKKRSKSRSGKSTAKSRSRRRSSKSKKEKKSTEASKGMEKNPSQEEKKGTSKVSGMKRDAAGGTLEERGVLALERVADSMEALVRTTLIAMMMKMVMESSIKVQ